MAFLDFYRPKVWCEKKHQTILNGVILNHTMRPKKSEALAASYLAWWESGLSAARLALLLNASREHTSRKLMPWARKALGLSEPKGSLHLSRSELDPEKLPAPIQSPENLLAILPGMLACLEGGESIPSVSRVSTLTTAACDPDIFRVLWSAYAAKRAVLLDYRAKSGPCPMWFSPHSAVETSHRIHFRGHVTWISQKYEDHQAPRRAPFYDIVPARIAAIEGESEEKYVADVLDELWYERVDIRLFLSKDLPETIRSAMIQEWGQQIRKEGVDFVLTVPAVRKAVASYVCDQLRTRSFQGRVYEIWIPEKALDATLGVC